MSDKSEGIFTVCPIGWEYNDEYYYQGEGGGYSRPLICFTIRELAEEYAEAKNVAEFKMQCDETYFGGYLSWEERYPETPEQARLMQLHNISEDELYVENFNQLKDNDIEEIMKAFDINFFEVVEVPLRA
jgi:hypothetical protein